ncbi:RHS repeat domain-containing protein [Cerasicoccus fimbriatus]|uniref:RHS repeat domain-containing protein n=1 Tax=Cerasicoccus fimbriatus TaxID=3014554 RepID=UPI0022B5C6AA|nr:RHS repeat-associated core domain-containing protein [Cerasicoccus sp. TK19100]
MKARIDAVDQVRTKRTYDVLGRVATYTNYREEDGATVGETLIYAYDQAGNLSRLIYPDGADVRYAYDAADRLIKVTDWADRETDITWNNQDRVESIDFPNGVQRNIRYDAAGNIIYREDLASDDSVIVAFAYSYDAAGRLQSEHTAPEPTTLPPTTATYSYDERNRLVSYNGGSVQSDPQGNLQRAVNVPSLNPSGAIVQFNNRGRLTQTASYAFTYNEEDRLIGWQPVGSAESQQTNFFVNPEAGMSQVLLQTGPSQSKRYVYGLGLFYEEDANTSDIKVLHYDSRGSTVAISDNGGELVGQIAYSPYGEIIHRSGDTDTLFLYCGMFGVMTSPEGLNYMRYRWYSPELRRFLSQDSHFGSIRDLNTLNRYAYAGGNPAMMVDPEGEFWWIAGGAAAGAAVGLTVTFVTDLIDDGQINTPGEQYASAAIGGAVTGALLSTGAGLGTGAGFALAAFAGGAGAAAENLSYAGLTGTQVDGKQLAFQTITGAALGVVGHGAGKVVNKAGAKFYAKSFGSTNRFIKFANSLARPDKISRRLAVSSYSNLVKRSAKKEAIQGALAVFKKLPGAVLSGIQSPGGLSSQPITIIQDGGQRGSGAFNIRSEALGALSLNQSRQYGEYIHYNFYLEAVQLTSQPVPVNPTHTLSGF